MLTVPRMASTTARALAVHRHVARRRERGVTPSAATISATATRADRSRRAVGLLGGVAVAAGDDGVAYRADQAVRLIPGAVVLQQSRQRTVRRRRVPGAEFQQRQGFGHERLLAELLGVRRRGSVVVFGGSASSAASRPPSSPPSSLCFRVFLVSAPASRAELVVHVLPVQLAHRALPRRREPPVLAPEEQAAEWVKRRHALHPERFHLPRQQAQDVGHRLVHVAEPAPVLLLNGRLASRLGGFSEAARVRRPLSSANASAASSPRHRVRDGPSFRQTRRTPLRRENEPEPARSSSRRFETTRAPSTKAPSRPPRSSCRPPRRRRVAPAVRPEGVREPKSVFVHAGERRIRRPPEAPRVREVLPGIERGGTSGREARGRWRGRSPRALRGSPTCFSPPPARPAGRRPRTCVEGPRRGLLLGPPNVRLGSAGVSSPSSSSRFGPPSRPTVRASPPRAGGLMPPSGHHAGGEGGRFMPPAGHHAGVRGGPRRAPHGFRRAARTTGRSPTAAAMFRDAPIGHPDARSSAPGCRHARS